MGSARSTKTTASAVSFGAILSCDHEILDFGLQLSFVYMVLLRPRLAGLEQLGVKVHEAV